MRMHWIGRGAGRCARAKALAVVAAGDQSLRVAHARAR